MTGGGTKGVEIYNPVTKTSCAMPPLPEVRSLHSQDGLLLCGGNENTHLKPTKTCVLFNSGKLLLKGKGLKVLKLLDNGSWIKSHSLPRVRAYHSSWTPAAGTGTYLFGGGNDEWTSHRVNPDGTVEESFRLKHMTV